MGEKRSRTLRTPGNIALLPNHIIRRLLTAAFYRTLRQGRSRSGRQAQRDGGPGAAGCRDPLIAAIRKAALFVGLQGEGAGANQPGAVRHLGAEEEARARAICRVGRRQLAGFMQGIHCLPGAVSVAFESVELAAAAVGALVFEEGLREVVAGVRTG